MRIALTFPHPHEWAPLRPFLALLILPFFVYLGDIMPLVAEVVEEGIADCKEIVEARRWGPDASDLIEELASLRDTVSRGNGEISLLGDTRFRARRS